MTVFEDGYMLKALALTLQSIQSDYCSRDDNKYKVFTRADFQEI